MLRRAWRICELPARSEPLESGAVASLSRRSPKCWRAFHRPKLSSKRRNLLTLNTHTGRRGERCVHQIARIARFRRFENENLGLGLGHRAMLDSLWHDTVITGSQNDAAISEFHRHLTAPNKEQFILILMMVPWKNAGEFDQFQFLAIDFGYDFGPPMLGDQRELLSQ
jgi:hypothetical protein